MISFKLYAILLVDPRVREMIFYELRWGFFHNIHHKSDQRKKQQVCERSDGSCHPGLVLGSLHMGWGHSPEALTLSSAVPCLPWTALEGAPTAGESSSTHMGRKASFHEIQSLCTKHDERNYDLVFWWLFKSYICKAYNSQLVTINSSL